MKLKFQGPVLMIFLVLFIGGTILVAGGPRYTCAYVTQGADCGLRVETAKDFVEVTNLNPGDRKNSYLTVYNDDSNELSYFFNLVKDDNESKPGEYNGEIGRELDELLELTAERNGEVLYQGPFGNFEELAMGDLPAGANQRLDIKVYLPGDTSNAYQGSSVTVKFAFRAACDGPGPDKPALKVFKFNDLNRNGVWYENEPAIPGWKVNINGTEYITPVNLSSPKPGGYTITEETRAGWRATTPTSVETILAKKESKTVTFGGSAPGSDKASLKVHKSND